MALLSNWIRGMSSSYPDPTSWKDQGDFAKKDVFRFTRLWLCEGIPYAFRNNAAAYELARENFGKVLGEHPRNVSMTGSGRLGFSLAGTKFGAAYNPDKSDVDLFLVSDTWFEKMTEDAELFIARLSRGLAVPRNEFEKKYWPENAQRLKQGIIRGHVNQHYIPNVERYKATRSCYKACRAFQATLGGEEGTAEPKKVSVRIYQNWARAESQIGGSLLFALKQTGHDIS
ncbi:hypothetical protein [Pseudophaeobacter arcticus]|jgi:hypothetical protein|uniref:hypothetical protein n=1 Tax=Pseudophaeobacter arcticus TaxID=385492 RepID=UPI0039E6220C